MGGSGARLGNGGTGGGTSGKVSSTSTGGKIVANGGGQWYGENNNGYGVSILDGGKSEIAQYLHGSDQVYEVRAYNPRGIQIGETSFQFTKSEAMSTAKNLLKKYK